MVPSRLSELLSEDEGLVFTTSAHRDWVVEGVRQIEDMVTKVMSAETGRPEIVSMVEVRFVGSCGCFESVYHDMTTIVGAPHLNFGGVLFYTKGVDTLSRHIFEERGSGSCTLCLVRRESV